MKIGILRALAHNIADSLGSGCGLLIGVYDMNVYGEAMRDPGGVIAIDFLAAKAIRCRASIRVASATIRMANSLKGAFFEPFGSDLTRLEAI